LARSRQDLARSHRNLARSQHIRPDLVQIWWISIESGVVLQISTLTENQPVSGEVRPSELTPLLVGGGSKNGRPEVIGSVLGWAQTRPRPTRGQA